MGGTACIATQAKRCNFCIAWVALLGGLCPPCNARGAPHAMQPPVRPTPSCIAKQCTALLRVRWVGEPVQWVLHRFATHGQSPCIPLGCTHRKAMQHPSKRCKGVLRTRPCTRPAERRTPVRPVRPMGCKERPWGRAPAPSLALLRTGGLRTPVRPVKAVRPCEACKGCPLVGRVALLCNAPIPWDARPSNPIEACEVCPSGN